MLLLLAGTKKGLFTYTSDDRGQWQMNGPFLPGQEVHDAVYDARNKRIFAASNNAWFGSEIVASDDLGATWTSAKQSPAYAEDAGQKVELIWHIEPGAESTPETLYAGVSPAGLFKSEDSGATWTEITSLSQHPTRPHWHPGAGGLCLHSIQVNPDNPEQLYIGISAVGVFRSDDGGQTWNTKNRGTRAEFMPDKYPEFGQCVHKLLLAPGHGELVFQQNHCGVYRSANGGDTWDEITKGLPSDFGFPLGIHPRDPQTIYVLPLQGGEFRCPPDGKLRVFRSRDGGENWEALTDGLPSDAYCGVLREAMDTDTCESAGVYFGTNTGKIFASNDEGDSWYTLADNLPPVFSVSVAEI